MGLTIYGTPMSRAFRVLWMAKELSIPYEHVPLDPRTGAVQSKHSNVRLHHFVGIEGIGHLVTNDGLRLFGEEPK